MTTKTSAAAPAVASRLFNGRYTIESTATGEHRTFWIETQPQDAKFAPGKRLLGILSGPDNDNPDCYRAFAFVSEQGISVWHRVLHGDEGGLYANYAEMLWSLGLDGGFSPWAALGYRLHVEGRCLRCNRTLTTPESIRRGIGPVCADM